MDRRWPRDSVASDGAGDLARRPEFLTLVERANGVRVELDALEDVIGTVRKIPLFQW